VNYMLYRCSKRRGFIYGMATLPENTLTGAYCACFSFPEVVCWAKKAAKEILVMLHYFS
jgi:hypothetical protein